MIPHAISRVVPAAARKPERHVLVVDDVPEIGEFYRALFRRVGAFRVRPTIELRSERAIELIGQRSFDLVITDYRMPERSGDAVISAAHRSLPGVPVILMTGAEEIAAAGRSDVTAVLAKPLDAREVIDLIERALTMPPGPSIPGRSSPEVAARERPPGELPPRSAYPPREP